MFNHELRRTIPIARIAVQLDRAYGADANVGAAPAPGFFPKFPAYGEVSVFQHAGLHMGSSVNFSHFTRHDAAQNASHGNAGVFRVVMCLQIDPALRIGAKEHAQA